MDKKLLNISFKSNSIEYFPYWDEKLFIDMKIKEDEDARKKASEYAKYLKELKEYVEFENETEVDEIIEFLKSKSEVLNDISPEEKRKYMELKFELLDIQKDVDILMENWVYQFATDINYFNIEEDLDEYFERFFPSVNNKYVNNKHEYVNYLPYFNTYSKNKTLNGTLSEIKEKNEPSNIININELEFIYPLIQNLKMLDKKERLLLPILFPIYKKRWKTSIIFWDLKIVNFSFKANKIKNEKKFLELINIFFVWQLECDSEIKYNLINQIFPKTNLFCDYRFFDREMFKM